MLPTLTNANKFLEHDEPLIHVLKSNLTHLIKDMVLKLASPCQVAQSYREETLASVNFADTAIQVSYEKPFVGHSTRQKTNNLLDDGDTSPHQIRHVLYLFKIAWSLL